MVICSRISYRQESEVKCSKDISIENLNKGQLYNNSYYSHSHIFTLPHFNVCV